MSDITILRTTLELVWILCLLRVITLISALSGVKSGRDKYFISTHMRATVSHLSAGGEIYGE